MRGIAVRSCNKVGGYWAAAWVLVIFYVAVYGSMIQRDTAVPYWDQSNYVGKTYRLVEAWNEAGNVRAGKHWWARVAGRMNPELYLSAAPPQRPPLLELFPGILWGHRASAHEMAWTWMLMRVAFLMAGAWVLARQAGDARWVPLALAVILASQAFLRLNQNVYLMDAPFAAGAVLAAALVLRAMRRRTARTALVAGAGTVMLLLIKPQALTFMFPFYVFLVGERLVRVWRERGRVAGWLQVKTLLGWSGALGLLLGAIVYLLRSSYGVAAADQYKMYAQGFWDHPVDRWYLWTVMTEIVPPWLFVAAVVVWGWRRMRRQGDAGRGLPGPMLLCTVVAAAWWTAFVFLLSSGIDPRWMWSIFPLVVCVCAISVWRSAGAGKAITGMAVAWFLLAVGVTLGVVPLIRLSPPGEIMGPGIATQHPPAEVGLMPFVQASGHEIGETAGTRVMVMACNDFLEAEAFNLAARWANHDHWSAIFYQAAPWGDDGFDVADLFVGPQSGWYATPMQRPTTMLTKAAFVNLLALHALITDGRSPIHELFEARVRQPLVIPRTSETGLYGEGGEGGVQGDELVLWRLKRPLTGQECRDAVRFVLSQYDGASGLSRMQGQLAQFERAAANGTGADVVHEADLPAVGEAVVHDVNFGGEVLLRGIYIRKEGNGLRVEFYWQAAADVDLVKTRFIHLLDGRGEITRQSNVPQDALRGRVRKGTLWRDVAVLSAEQLRGIKRLGIGLVAGDGKLTAIAPATGVTLDWNNQRMIVPLAQ